MAEELGQPSSAAIPVAVRIDHRVATGARDDAHRGRGYVVAALGWLATAAILWVLAGTASELAVRVTLFLSVVVVVVALVGVLAAVEVFRPPLIVGRAGTQRRARPINEHVDALGRQVDPVAPAGARELAVADVDAVRRYVRISS